MRIYSSEILLTEFFFFVVVVQRRRPALCELDWNSDVYNQSQKTTPQNPGFPFRALSSTQKMFLFFQQIPKNVNLITQNKQLLDLAHCTSTRASQTCILSTFHIRKKASIADVCVCVCLCARICIKRLQTPGDGEIWLR